MAFVKVITLDQLESGKGMVIEAEGKKIALFNVDGTFYAIGNTCPHKGGPLGEGNLDGKVISCPWHAWQFDVTTGISPVISSASVPTYNVKVEGNDILVEV